MILPGVILRKAINYAIFGTTRTAWQNSWVRRSWKILQVFAQAKIWTKSQPSAPMEIPSTSLWSNPYHWISSYHSSSWSRAVGISIWALFTAPLSYWISWFCPEPCKKIKNQMLFTCNWWAISNKTQHHPGRDLAGSETRLESPVPHPQPVGAISKQCSGNFGTKPCLRPILYIPWRGLASKCCLNHQWLSY